MQICIQHTHIHKCFEFYDLYLRNKSVICAKVPKNLKKNLLPPAQKKEEKYDFFANPQIQNIFFL